MIVDSHANLDKNDIKYLCSFIVVNCIKSFDDKEWCKYVGAYICMYIRTDEEWQWRTWFFKIAFMK